MVKIFLIVLLSLSLNAYDLSNSLQIRTFLNGDLVVSDTSGMSSNLISGRRATLEKNKANYDYSLLGMQINFKLNDYIDIMAQGIYARKEPDEDYKASLEWLLLGIDLGSNYKLHLGKMRIPFMKYTQLHYMGYAYLWSRPQLIGGVNGFDELYAFNLQKNTHINDIDITFELTAGKAKHKNQRDENRWIYIFSTELNYEGSLIRASYGQARFKHIAPSGKVLSENALLKFGSIEMEMHFDNLGIYAGFSKNASSDIPEQMFYYGSLSYKMGKFTPLYNPNIDKLYQKV